MRCFSRGPAATLCVPCLLVLVAWSLPVQAQSRLEKIEPFLMDRAEEVALARSAGPRGIGEAATVFVLTPEGYELAISGSNEFTCFVGRGWSGPVIMVRNGETVVHPDALDPGIRAPHCFNRPATESILRWHMVRTDALLAGVPAEEVPQVTARALEAGELQVPGHGAIAYMTSSKQHLGDRFGHWRPHMMMYTPYATNASIGAPGFSNDFPIVAEAGTPWAVTVVQMRFFSDGTSPAADPTRDSSR